MGEQMTTRIVSMMAGAVLLGWFALPPAAQAAAPVGACCLADQSCQDVISMQCASINGTFIGEGTSCQRIDCSGSLAAPVLSIAGLIAGLGALGGFGVYRLAIRRRAQ